MARHAQERNPLSQLYTLLAIRRMLQKQQEQRDAAIRAATQAPPPGPGVPDISEAEPGTWTQLPGGRSERTNFIAGEGGRPGYEEFYKGSPYYDRGRNWSSPAAWDFFGGGWNWENPASQRIPDWMRYIEPSPELTAARQQVKDLRNLDVENAAMRADNARILQQLGDVNAEQGQRVAMEQAWDLWRKAGSAGPPPSSDLADYDPKLQRNIDILWQKDRQPGIADVYGRYDDSQDRYADAPPQPGIINEAFPENPMPGPRWGVQGRTPDTLSAPEFAKPGRGPGIPPAGKGRKAWTVEPIKEAFEGQYRVPDEKGKLQPGEDISWGMPRKIQVMAPPGSLPKGEDSPPPGRAPYIIQDQPEANPWSEAMGVVGGGTSQPAMPPAGTLWDNYPTDFTLAMHSGDEKKIEKAAELNPFDW